MMPADLRVVAFADILGFADLTENNPVDTDRLNLLAGPVGENVFAQIEATKADPLAATFIHFHRGVTYAIDMATIEHRVTSIAFSDSAFFATARLHEAVQIANRLLLHSLWQKVPIRVGIAFGTFAVLGFDSRTAGSATANSAQFLGTAVVRAHAAESCGLKGIRVFLHPTAADLVGKPDHNPNGVVRVLSCPEDSADNKARVATEVNYWPNAPTEEKRVWQSLQDMWHACPPAARHQYHATATAINRMRIALGEPPMDTLRRRTLPQRVRPRA